MEVFDFVLSLICVLGILFVEISLVKNNSGGIPQGNRESNHLTEKYTLDSDDTTLPAGID